jgi:hypothetical protein
MDVTILSLWLPILLSAVIVWVLSSLVWTVMPHRKKEFSGAPNEEAVRSALRDAAPGQYWVPWGQDFKDAGLHQKYKEGPTGIIQLWQPGMPNMPKNLGLSYLYYVVVGIVVAYITSRTLGSGAEYLQVHRVAGCVAWVAYSFAVIPESIWFGRPWSSTVKTLFEALAYGLFTGGVFGWLWPGG